MANAHDKQVEAVVEVPVASAFGLTLAEATQLLTRFAEGYQPTAAEIASLDSIPVPLTQPPTAHIRKRRADR